MQVARNHNRHGCPFQNTQPAVVRPGSSAVPRSCQLVMEKTPSTKSKPVSLVVKMGEAFVKLPGAPAMSQWVGTHEGVCLTLLTSAWLSLAVVAIYLTTVVHPGFLPLLLLAVFVLCHVLINPRQAKHGNFGAPVIRFAMPEELVYTMKVVQPTYKTISKDEISPKVKVNVPMPIPCSAAYCNAQTSISSLHTPTILVV